MCKSCKYNRNSLLSNVALPQPNHENICISVGLIPVLLIFIIYLLLPFLLLTRHHSRGKDIFDAKRVVSFVFPV